MMLRLWHKSSPP